MEGLCGRVTKLHSLEEGLAEEGSTGLGEWASEGFIKVPMAAAWKEGKSGNVPRVVLVVTKIDLLPSSLSPTRLEHWVGQRAREEGASRITSVHFVSAVRDWVLKNLIDGVRELVGARGNVWTIGSHNAWKSTLINVIAKHISENVTQLTEAFGGILCIFVIVVRGVDFLSISQLGAELARDKMKALLVEATPFIEEREVATDESSGEGAAAAANGTETISADGGSRCSGGPARGSTQGRSRTSSSS
ncbi:hypothetical protein Scep_015465 [Stephania cephalantha]|uniref:G domain-containing protein n=1 Tax=Stephania cephalantha TaxID=152367 RepID=A0AAP0J391_9MAGN